ncbi:MAG TPA: tetratricopeptide repeat protein [Casimicrobiaceae bacterium]|nr:tetratricopeptide repeat protein [Casimicrobiaceae bacterium]
MKEYAPGIEPAELSLVDVPAPSTEAAEALASPAPAAPAATDPIRTSTPTGWEDPARASVATGADRFLTQAINEHAAGHIDRTLWERAVAQAGGDNARAKSIYVQSRATALRVTKREKKAVRYARVVEVLSNAPEPGFGLPVPGEDIATAATGSDNAARDTSKRNRRRAMVAAGVFGSLVVVAGLVVALSDSGPVRQDIAAKPAPRFNVFARSTPSTQAIPAITSTASAVAGFGEDFVGKVRALKTEGNWHVVVLYAVEWTRKQPGNADAWKELSQGYIKLRQYGEAQDAATKAVQLAPDDFLQWQNLGQINLAIPAPAEALKAFHQATVLNDHDVVSLVQAGILNAQLGRLPEAGAAFDKALTVIPQDVQALCGATWVAQREGRVKDAQAMTRQVTSLGEHCSDQGGGASVRVAAGESPRAKTTP